MGRSHIDPRVHTELNKVAWGHNAIYAGAVTGTGATQALSAAHYLIAEVLVQADADNSADVTVGNVTARTITLEAGDSMVIPINDLRKVYVDVALNDIVNWLAVG